MMFERKHVIAVAAASLAALALAAVPAAPATATVSSVATAAQPVVIAGEGSVWAQNAIDEWVSNVSTAGLQVVYSGDGSAAGRFDYQLGTTDFAASDTPYRDGSDKFSNLGPEQTNVGYSYVPDVGGAVAFMYHLSVRGHAITNLRLSDETIFRIFTGQITNWDNPAITHDYGSQLPSTPIVPVIHAGSAGSTYYFTNWLAHVYPRQWNAFCDSVASWIRPPCGPTAFYPQVGNAQAADGSAAVATDVTTTNGAIGYDEYSYPLQAQIPVVRLRNPDGRYVLPQASNVTTALRKAVVNDKHASPDFLEENLDGVYTDKNPNSYPVSYYSYLIVPRSGTTVPSSFTSAEGKSLSEFVYYALCTGQQYVAPIGYAPLTGNLIRNGLKQVRRIPGHFAMPSLSECHDLPH